MEAYRGEFTKITEIFIPEFNLSINTQSDHINIFRSSKERYMSNNTNMSRHNPVLLKSVRISTNSEIGKTLRWFDELYRTRTI